MNGRAELLDARLLTRLERLQLGTRRRLAGVLAGEHRSPLRGSSLEFSDHRPYTPGDDIRRIDPHLYARLDVLMIKLFEAEDDLALRLLVDTSASMGMSGKLTQAARLAAALGFVGLVRRDTVSVHSFPGTAASGLAMRRFRGRAASSELFDHLAALSASGRTPFLSAAGRLLAQPGPPGLTVLVSDLLTPEWIDGLDRLPARGGDVAVVHVLGREDLDPDLVGDLDLVDVEGGPSVAASCSPETLDAYRRHALAWADEVAGRCRSRRVGYVRVSADDDVESALLGPARMSGILR
jgi:uncharacterized protein (DUF58 family)